MRQKHKSAADILYTVPNRSKKEMRKLNSTCMQADNEISPAISKMNKVYFTNLYAALKEWLCLQIWSMLSK